MRRTAARAARARSQASALGIRTGACLDGAGSDPVDLRTWPVAVVDGEVWIEPRGDEVTGSPFDRSVT